MVIRCPHCQFSRSITLDKIPATAEVATCPKCNQRFRFRTIPKKIIPELHQNLRYDQESEDAPREEELAQHQHSEAKDTQALAKSDGETSPQTPPTNKKAKEQAPKKDIWDALSSLTKLWEKEKKSDSNKPSESNESAHTDISEHTGRDERPSSLAVEDATPEQEQDAFFATTGHENGTSASPLETGEEAYPAYLQREGEDSSVVYSPTPTEEFPEPASTPEQSSQLLPKDDKDVEIHIHYVDGKPASFRNPWVKKNAPAPEEVNQTPEHTSNQEFEINKFSADSEAFSAASSFFHAEAKVPATPTNIPSDPQLVTGSGKNKKRAEKPERPLTPLESLMAQGAQESSPPPATIHHRESEQPIPSSHYDEADDSHDTHLQEAPTGKMGADYANMSATDNKGEDVASATHITTPLQEAAEPTSQRGTLDISDACEGSAFLVSEPAAPQATQSEEIQPQGTPHNDTLHDETLPDETHPESIQPEGTESLVTQEVDTKVKELNEETQQDKNLHAMASLIKANKPFDYQDTTPEERVEKDLCFLQTDAKRPTKELGMLRETQPDSTLHPFSETREIPWEHPQTYGVFSSLLRTIKSVMFSAPAFFRTIPPLGGMAFAFLFFILHGYLAVMCTTFWIILAAILFDIPTLGHVQDLVPSIALFTPVALSLVLIAATSFTRIFLILFQRQQASFAFTFKLLCYSIAPLLLSIIPFVGPMAGLIWSFIILGTACHHSTGLSPARAIITVAPTCLLTLWLLFLLLS